jgi:hypothetical protein
VELAERDKDGGEVARPHAQACEDVRERRRRYELELQQRCRGARQQARKKAPQPRHARGKLSVEEELAGKFCAALHDNPVLDAHDVAGV